MTWHTIKPTNTGGGRQRTTPAAKLYESGQLTINAAAGELLGYPDRVLLTVDPDAKRMRLTPTTPDNAGGFSLSGGGNTPHRIRCTEVVRRWPSLAGDYTVQRIAGGVELRIEDGEDGELEL
jgi:hypothetical protein